MGLQRGLWLVRFLGSLSAMPEEEKGKKGSGLNRLQVPDQLRALRAPPFDPLQRHTHAAVVKFRNLSQLLQPTFRSIALRSSP